MRLFKKQSKPAEVAPKELVRRVEALETKLEQTAQQLDVCKQHMQCALSKIGITRFNPFREMGGDQSFSIALLDAQHNGLVLTSYYGRELNRVYAKPIKNGTSEHGLSAEEKEAIDQAVGQAK